MRPSNKQRSRNKPGGNGNHNNNQRRNIGNIINRVFESAGPDGKVRGTPQQIIDKYQALARDAQVSGDRVAAENYLQHSEHYSRLLGEAQRQNMEQRFNGPDREDGGRGEDVGERPQPQRQPGMMPQPVASGLTTIDTDDSDYLVGPIETPEGRRAPSHEPAPLAQPDRAPDPAPVAVQEANGAEQAAAAAPAEEPAAEPAKRSRPRRRSKPAEPVPPEAEAAAGQPSS
jgi:hypothetical protein